MKFYYRYVCGLKEPDSIMTEIDPAVFGKLLHGVMEKIYLPFEGKIIAREKISDLRKDVNLLRQNVGDVIRKIYHSGDDRALGGSDEITAGILLSYARMILDLDSTFAPLTITGLEKFVSSGFVIKQGNSDTRIVIGGFTDRIDETGGTRRVIDYKTGNISMEIRSVATLFDENDERNDAWFQILMYCEILSENSSRLNVRPSLYALRKMADEDFSDKLVLAPDRENKTVIDDYSAIRPEYSSGLKQTLENIFRTDSQFIMTEHLGKCEHCPFIKLCRR